MIFCYLSSFCAVRFRCCCCWCCCFLMLLLVFLLLLWWHDCYCSCILCALFPSAPIKSGLVAQKEQFQWTLFVVCVSIWYFNVINEWMNDGINESVSNQHGKSLPIKIRTVERALCATWVRFPRIKNQNTKFFRWNFLYIFPFRMNFADHFIIQLEISHRIPIYMVWSKTFFTTFTN